MSVQDKIKEIENKIKLSNNDNDNNINDEVVILENDKKLTYYEKNKESYKAKNKLYYESKGKEIKSSLKEKVECPVCCIKISKGALGTHLKSKKCEKEYNILCKLIRRTNLSTERAENFI